ncbi:DUF4405 domain-containing protein [Calditerrivibrio nitroreducens]|uniref:Flavinylation-associated cytochrome domain-containing protein n=1 Tax=Calditerrivibrio nitroreducens (strain DSM 19672 / NBRC 101217 / Yu37-1) TaxID=768670 RepID=E4TFY8_CALNY|nr:DUF4405 domain-containing protein [Calditerrivibrio nitroreducens]ADR18538.1 hypothetical protein Calni_0626 [Calditerrivibrio nitroreducens DSM 19672]
MFRKIVSLTTLWSFIGMTFTGIILFIVPEGRVAYWADLHIIGLTKDQWGDLHTTISALFMISGLLHTYLNWNAIVLYFKSKAKKIVIFTPSFTISTIIFLIFIVGTYYKVSPFKDLLVLSDKVKESWREKVGTPPYPHAELSKLNDLCKKEGLDINVVVQILKDNNVQFSSPDEKFLDISRKNKLSPSSLWDLIESKYDEYEDKIEGANNATSEKMVSENQPTGLGKMKLSEFSKKYKISIDDAIITLKKEGFNPKEDMTLKEIAEQKQVVPMDLYDLLLKNKKK